jgi:hypothetical protein
MGLARKGQVLVMPINVLLDNIAGLGAPVTFGPVWYQTTFPAILTCQQLCDT